MTLLRNEESENYTILWQVRIHKFTLTPTLPYDESTVNFCNLYHLMIFDRNPFCKTVHRKTSFRTLLITEEMSNKL